MQQVGEQIRARRRSLRLTQQELADLAQVSERYIRELESGKETIRLDKLLDVAGVLGLQLRLEVRS